MGSIFSQWFASHGAREAECSGRRAQKAKLFPSRTSSALRHHWDKMHRRKKDEDKDADKGVDKGGADKGGTDEDAAAPGKRQGC